MALVQDQYNVPLPGWLLGRPEVHPEQLFGLQNHDAELAMAVHPVQKRLDAPYVRVAIVAAIWGASRPAEKALCRLCLLVIHIADEVGKFCRYFIFIFPCSMLVPFQADRQ